jgi:hypothetical protein
MRLDKFTIDTSKPAHLGWWAEYFEISRANVTRSDLGMRALDVQLYLHSQAAHQPTASSIGTEGKKAEEPHSCNASLPDMLILASSHWGRPPSPTPGGPSSLYHIRSYQEAVSECRN